MTFSCALTVLYTEYAVSTWNRDCCLCRNSEHNQISSFSSMRANAASINNTEIPFYTKKATLLYSKSMTDSIT